MRRVLALIAVPLALLAGCGPGGPSSGSAPSGSPSGASPAAFDERAAQVAAAWRASGVTGPWRNGFVPLQDLTVLPPEAGFTEDTKQAYAAGWFRRTAQLPAKTPADGVARFPGGGSLPVPLVSAAGAYQLIDKGDPPCTGRRDAPPAAPQPADKPAVPAPAGQTAGPESPPAPAAPDSASSRGAPGQCTALTVTGARLGSVQLLTSRGEATVPAWVFTVDELAAPLARVAVAPAAITAVPSLSAPPYQPAQPAADEPALVPAQDLTKVDGARLTYRLGVGACDKDITPLVYETEDVVVVGGSAVRSAEQCVLMLKLEPVTVTLAAPLGARPVLDAINGSPLALSPR